MNKEYIERGALLNSLKYLEKVKSVEYSYADEWRIVLQIDAIVREVKAAIRTEQAADVVEIQHGVWEEEDVYWDEGILCLDYSCSLCGETVHDMHNYCPECGAKMDGGAEHGKSW